MELSRLEIKGFKSFADKITVNFDRGVTGVVGPNGCGKSNIVDSIRWVLGEQKTKNLRSDKMEDVIFNGTGKRKPTQLAEVAITFKNTKNILPTEYSEVTVTRKYYRDGESEYLLNGVKCRLKDINTLFMDTGIGPDSYSIIELEMVKDILNDTNDARRVLFEEASGISKFKKRKKETLKKLEDTLGDLERVSDLLFEIEKQMKALERQAKKAEEYYTLQKEYKRLSLLIAQLSIQELERKNDQLQLETQKIQSEQEQLHSQIAVKEAGIEKQRLVVLDSEKLLRSRQNNLNEFENEIRKKESERQLKNERLKTLNERETGLLNQINRDKDKKNQLLELSEKSKRVYELNLNKLQSAEKQVSEQKEKVDVTTKARLEKEKEVKELEQELKQLEQELYQLNKQKEITWVQINALEKERNRNTTDASSSQESLKEFDDKIAVLEEQLLVQKEEVEVVKEKKRKHEQDTQQAKSKLKALTEKLTQNHRKYDSIKHEFELAKSLVENLEGFPEAVKYVAKSLNLEGKALLLGDVFSCPEQIRPALEHLLEPYINYFIVENRKMALQAILALDSSQKGRANFFLLDSFDFLKNPKPETPANSKPLLEFVEYPAEIEPLAVHLLGNVFVVEDQKFLPEKSRATFVTQNGTIIQHQQSLHGGSIGLFAGKRLGRAKNLEKLEGQLSELAKTIKAGEAESKLLEKHLDELEKNQFGESLNEAERKFERTRSEISILKSRKEQMEVVLLQTRERESERLQRIKELQQEASAKEPLIEEAQGRFTHLNDLLQKVKVDFERLREEQRDLSGAYNQLNIEYHKALNERDAAKRELDYVERDSKEVEKRLEDNHHHIVRVQQNKEELLKSETLSEDDLLALYVERDSLKEGLTEAEKNYYSVRGGIEEEEGAIRKLRQQLDQKRELLQHIQHQANSCLLELTAVKERIKVEFNIDVLEALREEIGEESVKELKEQVQGIKSKMERIGPINPTAMEAYQEIKERFDFITAQKDDLLKAKSSLEETISEIDTKAKSNFLETFERVRQNFIHVFRTLFTEEDEADLVLLEPENPLESKIEIMAKPKGKRPQSVNQLSGGEKTLTATALLFSIYLIKPAPFCIFDEVDAPLDDANIDKFNQIIREFSKESQFIIVTHNKRTMAHTDTIYGVTMMEQGVSKVLPVDIRDLD